MTHVSLSVLEHRAHANSVSIDYGTCSDFDIGTCSPFDIGICSAFDNGTSSADQLLNSKDSRSSKQSGWSQLALTGPHLGICRSIGSIRELVLIILVLAVVWGEYQR